jgi:hypothetical protein
MPKIKPAGFTVNPMPLTTQKLRSSEWSRLFWAGRISHFLEGELFANE